MVRWLRWHCPPDTGFEIRALAVWGRARYFSVTEKCMGKKHFFFLKTAETGNRTPNTGVKGSGANHYPRAPAQIPVEHLPKIAPGDCSIHSNIFGMLWGERHSFFNWLCLAMFCVCFFVSLFEIIANPELTWATVVSWFFTGYARDGFSV